MAREIEAKIKVDGFDRLRDRLDRLGAAYEGEGLERNWILDDPQGRLHAGGTLLRVRNNGDAGAILTVKRKIEGSEFKTREEVESMVDSTEDLLRQLELVGFHIVWIYEKYRQTWLWRDCIVTLDELPEIGCYVEIEGAPDMIRAAASELGLDVGAHIDDNYLGLWQKHLAARGEKTRNMVFPPETVKKRKVTEVYRKREVE